MIVSPDLEEDDNVEDEGDEDEDDAGKDPGGEGGQSDRIWRGRPKSWGEEVHQHLNEEFFFEQIIE